MKKFSALFSVCALFLAFLFSDNNKEIANSNSHLLATNFPTPGWPVCSKCGNHHPGQPCPKDNDNRAY